MDKCGYGGPCLDGCISGRGGYCKKEGFTMTPERMARDALEAMQNGTKLTMILPKKKPKGFPHGTLLCEHDDGTCSYSFDPIKIIVWLNANKMVEVIMRVKIHGQEK